MSSKLAFHVRKLATLLGVNDTEETTLDNFVRQLCSNYKEYELQLQQSNGPNAMQQLRADIKVELVGIIAEKRAKQLSSSVSAASLSSLNSAVTSKFSRSTSQSRLANVEMNLSLQQPTGTLTDTSGVTSNEDSEPTTTTDSSKQTGASSTRKKRKQTSVDAGSADGSTTKSEPANKVTTSYLMLCRVSC
jgi:hypothetical protein